MSQAIPRIGLRSNQLEKQHIGINQKFNGMPVPYNRWIKRPGSPSSSSDLPPKKWTVMI